MKATVKWIDGMSFVAEADSGHALVLDAAPEAGGRNLGMRPMELLLAGMGGCTAIDVMSMLHKSRQPVTGCRVELSAERAIEAPKVFTAIHVHFVISGRGVGKAQVERAIGLSAEKYCSASIMLGATARVTHDYEIVEPDPA